MIFNQPKLLPTLFFTELWERFGYMSLQTIFVLYLTHALHYSDHFAYILIGAFGALQWVTPIPGGYIADRFIGFQRAVIIGGALLALGYFILALPQANLFLIGLAVLIIANGFFKPNVSSIVGTLYSHNDPRRDSGFTLFYMGINLGVLFPPLFMHALVQHFGWHAGFVLAGVGMLISLIIFLSSYKKIKALQTSLNKTNVSSKPTFNIYFIVGIVFFTILAYGALFIPQQSEIILALAGTVTIGFLLRLVLKLESKERNNMLVCIILTIISIGFWSIYMQTFSSVLMFADRNMSTHFLFMTINSEFTQSFNPFYIIVLSPVLMWLWPKLSQRNWNPSYPTKFALGVFLIALGAGLLVIATTYFSPKGLTNPWWLAGSYLLQTLGELVLSPIGLAMITALAPKRYVGMMMGVWFIALAASFAVGGLLATIADVPVHSTLLQSQAIYRHAFLDYLFLGLALTLLSVACIPKLKRMIS